MRMALELSFGQRGWHVDAASGKSEALRCFRRTHHALVVSDVRMTDGNGFELLHELCAIAPQTSVILLTAFGAVPDAVSAMKAGACEYITKPVVFEQLLDVSEQLILQSSERAVRRENAGMVDFSLSGTHASLAAIDEIKPPDRNSVEFSPGVSLEFVEKRLLEMTLAATAGNRSRAAEMLGISLRTVRNKIREYSLPPRRDYARVHVND